MVVAHAARWISTGGIVGTLHPLPAILTILLFLTILAALARLYCCVSQPAKPDPRIDALNANTEPRLRPVVFIGGKDAIFSYEFVEDGRLLPIGGPKFTSGEPSWLCPSGSGTRLYAVDEGKSGGCVALSVHRNKLERLRIMNKAPDPLAADGPCHCALDATGRWLLASNYSQGSVCVYEVTKDGKLGRISDARVFGTSDRPSHAHCGTFSPDNRFAFVCDLGLDGIHQFLFDAATGRLMENAHEPFSRSSNGSGPRHMAWHPSGIAAYCINETDSTIDTFLYIQAEGRLRRQQTLSTLPDNFRGQSYCAEIKVSSDGHFVCKSLAHSCLARRC